MQYITRLYIFLILLLNNIHFLHAQPTFSAEINGPVEIITDISTPLGATDNSQSNYVERNDFLLRGLRHGLFISVSPTILTTGSVYLQSGNKDMASNVGEMYLNPFGGNVGIGTGALGSDFDLEVNGTAGKPGGGSWSNSSDRRLKTDIEDYKDGLKEILQIRPVWYRYNGKYGLPTDKRYVGIIAQEIEKIAPYTITPYIEKNNKTGETGEYLSYNGTAITYMLVNAAQEQHENLEELAAEKDREIAALKNEIEELKKLVYTLIEEQPKPLNESNSSNNSTANTAIQNYLFQNTPNPFTTETIITYNLPKTAQKATIHITDLNGKILQSYPINNIGKGEITVQGNSFAAGIYVYSLELDGQIVASNKMALSK